ncbi:hypothetical protein AAY473_013523 [Plecturocebus cupreus]
MPIYGIVNKESIFMQWKSLERSRHHTTVGFNMDASQKSYQVKEASQKNSASLGFLTDLHVLPDHLTCGLCVCNVNTTAQRALEKGNRCHLSTCDSDSCSSWDTCLRGRLTFESVDWEEQTHSQSGWKPPNQLPVRLERQKNEEGLDLAESSSLHLSPVLEASCPGTLGSKFFSFWTLGLTLVVCQELSRLSHRPKAALLASLLVRFWDLDWLPGSSAYRQPVVGFHLVMVSVNTP